ncbi:MAG: D-aminoacyl-tRNA deacylase [Bacteroidales bacterium]|jgi:D-tyrosyl-tRNA(Tyr) deacylase
MRVVVQRVKEASVTVGTNVLSSIQKGLLVLVGIEENDNEEDAKWIAKKIYNLRIFDDDAGVMNLSVVEIGGDILVVSQFTLHASTKKGNRPSYIKAAKPEKAILLYNCFVESLSNLMEKPIPTGKFGAMMEINLVNSGPVTIIIDSKNRE